MYLYFNLQTIPGKRIKLPQFTNNIRICKKDYIYYVYRVMPEKGKSILIKVLGIEINNTIYMNTYLPSDMLFAEALAKYFFIKNKKVKTLDDDVILYDYLKKSIKEESAELHKRCIKSVYNPFDYFKIQYAYDCYEIIKKHLNDRT